MFFVGPLAWLVVFVVLVTVAVVARLARYRRCPNCRSFKLWPRLSVPADKIMFYRCRHCMAEFAEQRKQGLVPLDEWHQGARSKSSLPKAELRR